MNGAIRPAAAALILGTLLAASAATPPGVAAFVRDQRLTRYDVALYDLNGDGRPEALVYATASGDGGGAANLCGSGGCNLHVLSLTATGYRPIGRISITRPPIRVLANRTRGWRDLGVRVAGGGIIKGYEARLRFDGRGYPSNPTVPPAIRSHDPAGEVLIGTATAGR